MQRYNITELSSKTLEELQEIAREIGFSPDAFPEKRELIYEILDQQAVTVAETTSDYGAILFYEGCFAF